MQGGKVLLIAESRAYFTVYRTITDTGMRAYQLDRDGGHESGTLSREVRVPLPPCHKRPRLPNIVDGTGLQCRFVMATCQHY